MKLSFQKVPRWHKGWLRLGRWWLHPWHGRVLVVAGGTAQGLLDQDTARFRNDDGSETTATWVATEGSNASLNVDTNYRIRIQVQETDGTTTTFSPVLRYSHNGGAYTVVSGSSNVVRASASTQFADDATTTAQLTSPGGSFVAGRMDENGGTTADITVTDSNYTEVEWCFQIRSADVANNDTVAFRAYDGTGALNSYTTTLTATVVEGAVVLSAGTPVVTTSAPAVTLVAGAVTKTLGTPTVTFTAPAVTRLAVATLATGSPTVTFSAPAVTRVATRSLTVGLTVTFTAPGVTLGSGAVTLATGTPTVTFTAPAVTRVATRTLALGAVTVTFTAPAVTRVSGGVTLSTGTPTVTFSAPAVTVNVGGGAQTLSAGTPVVTFTAPATTRVATRTLPLGTGMVTFTAGATLLAVKTLGVGTGQVLLTAPAVTRLANRNMPAGATVTFTAPQVIIVGGAVQPNTDWPSRVSLGISVYL